jgi:hypothetical protein
MDSIWGDITARVQVDLMMRLYAHQLGWERIGGVSEQKLPTEEEIKRGEWPIYTIRSMEVFQN